MSSLTAGLAVGVGMWVIVDEGANALLGLTPPAPAWPVVTHLRALARTSFTDSWWVRFCK